MIEFEHLFQFVAFGMYGTLSKTAEILHVSQPTLTRNMKLLEKEFGVILFARSKNHIALNENGLLAIKEARKILSEIEVMTDKVRQLDRSRHTLSLGSCAPYPVMDFVRLATELYPSQSLTTELRSTEPLLQGLRDGRGAIKDFRLESIDLFSNELSHSVMEPDTIPSRICKDNRPLFVRGTP